MPELDIEVRPHHPQVRFRPRHTKLSQVKTVAILGAISEIKGLFVYKKIADELGRIAPEINIVFFGYTSDDSLFDKNSNVIITGEYDSAADLKELINFYEPVAALHFPIWPETFSYTLSEALSFGLMPFYYSIGALGERLDKSKYKYRYDLDESPSAIAQDIKKYIYR
jgi:glycosyltransferase involved in cell wall biosynthesis